MKHTRNFSHEMLCEYLHMQYESLVGQESEKSRENACIIKYMYDI